MEMEIEVERLSFQLVDYSAAATNNSDRAI